MPGPGKEEPSLSSEPLEPRERSAKESAPSDSRERPATETEPRFFAEIKESNYTGFWIVPTARRSERYQHLRSKHPEEYRKSPNADLQPSEDIQSGTHALATNLIK